MYIYIYVSKTLASTLNVVVGSAYFSILISIITMFTFVHAVFLLFVLMFAFVLVGQNARFGYQRPSSAPLMRSCLTVAALFI